MTCIGTDRRTRTAVYLNVQSFLFPEIPLSRWSKRKDPGRLFFQFLRNITDDLCWNSIFDSIAREVNIPETEDCVKVDALSTMKQVDPYCENDTDRSFASIVTSSLMIASFALADRSSHSLASCFPTASSMMMYFDPTGLSSLELQQYSLGIGMWSIVRTWTKSISLR